MTEMHCHLIDKLKTDKTQSSVSFCLFKLNLEMYDIINAKLNFTDHRNRY